ncbi:hypothetical protein pdam_00024500 [Pocillopora damicornis]|uniref:Uncharacterized protein n=1 Tax=Pocillopora damicornis TaxID=46731 RepID=A0A3M6V0D7_POCDA|nr:hypothetical protein pdam_00024500 [Pocillopora damicornis]
MRGERIKLHENVPDHGLLKKWFTMKGDLLVQDYLMTERGDDKEVLSFERFQQTKSVEDEKKSVYNAVPKATAYKTKWLFEVFEKWKQNRLVKSCTLEPGGLFTTRNKEYKLWTRPL